MKQSSREDNQDDQPFTTLDQRVQHEDSLTQLLTLGANVSVMNSVRCFSIGTPQSWQWQSARTAKREPDTRARRGLEPKQRVKKRPHEAGLTRPGLILRGRQTL